MRTPQKLAAAALLLALAAASYGIFLLGHASIVSAKRKVASSEAALVDQTPFKSAQQLAQLADTPEEQEIAKEALRLGDYELDLSFSVALQEAEAHPPELSAEAQQILARLKQNQKLQQALQAQVDQLTAAVAKSTGARKAELQDQLDIANSNLSVAANDVDDASRDLTDAGGNQRDRIEKMKEAHEEADKSRKNPDDIFPRPAPDKLGIVYRVQQWSALNRKKALLLHAKSDADTITASLGEQHDALSAQLDAEKFNSPDLAAHSTLAQANSSANSDSATPSSDAAIASLTGSIAKSRTTAEKKITLAAGKAIALDQRNLTSLDKRVDNEKELSQNYAQWIDIVSDRQRLMVRQILIGIAVVLGIALIGVFFNTWLDKILGTVRVDRRQIQTLRTTARVAVQVIAVLLVLLVIFGPPSNLGTFIGLATAGLTVALKDFIVGFLGWFVLMGKNGIRLGD